ncbi:cellulose binding domain-containing protein [Streptomyces jumonjinensis]|uniref:Fibronectin type III domain-containing protein n=1 Tax=Streptomyces jumonjinensis TaxID=1945 RepID=A0A646KIB8_STRJU|nr:cellulose binding domain-containing protein [Streptomyces jumonjinensis]MQT02009.1 hypothetical protein [Streptomyces jumonjinensis]
MRRSLASLVATVLGVLTLLGAPPASATSPLVLVTAESRKTSSWESGYQGTYTIKNHSRTALDSWTVEFSLPVNTTVTTHWDAQLTRDGDRYTFRSVGYNGSLAPGASTTFGWVAQGSGVPGRCVVNKGGPCEEDSDITPPTVPTGLHVTAIEDRALTLNWTASVDDRSPVVDYEIFVDGVRHSTLTGVTSHRMTGLRPNTAYMFRLLARDLAGNRSALSHAVTGATGDPSPPRTLSTAPYVDMGT